MAKVLPISLVHGYRRHICNSLPKLCTFVCLSLKIKFLSIMRWKVLHETGKQLCDHANVEASLDYVWKQ